jgi:signal transduction histidine kinase
VLKKTITFAVEIILKMKKTKIWIPIAVLAFIVVGLVVLQLGLIGRTALLYEQHFRLTVESVLHEIENEIEDEEIKNYLEEITSNILDLDVITNGTSENELNLKSKEINSSIQGVNRVITENYQKKYLRNREIVNKVMARLMINDANLFISKKIDFSNVLEKTTTRLQDVGIEQPFYFSILDKDNREFFSNYNIKLKNSRLRFQQELFPYEKKKDPYFINICFSNENSFRQKATKMAVPSMIITLLLFLTVVSILYYLLVQKRGQETKTEFLNNMTHELKTPIASIYLASQMLKDGAVLKLPAILEHISRVISDETKRLTVLVEKVLQTSVFETQKSVLKLKEDDINELIDRIVKNFSIKFSSKDGKIISALNAENPIALLDDTHFTNVIYNLLENSAKYRKDSPLIINVSTWNSKDNVFVSIEDNGIGIKKNDIKHIFEKFYRVSTGNKHDVKGYGLGLAYVKKIVEEHKGSIEVESEFGVGTKFVIKLPAVIENFE